MISELTNQAAFTIAYRHLLKQGVRSEVDNKCRYRARRLKCGVGALIPDSLYDPRMEGLDAERLVEVFPKLERRLGKVSPQLLSELQGLHDVEEPSCWEHELWLLGERYGLNVPNKGAADA